jgi:hypothetical protein
VLIRDHASVSARQRARILDARVSIVVVPRQLDRRRPSSESWTTVVSGQRSIAVAQADDDARFAREQISSASPLRACASCGDEGALGLAPPATESVVDGRGFHRRTTPVRDRLPSRSWAEERLRARNSWWLVVVLFAACLSCHANTVASQGEDAGDASVGDEQSSDGDVPDGAVADSVSQADAWDDDAHPECLRDANATIAQGGVCCISDNDCQGPSLIPPRLACCFDHVCLYCGPK